MKRWKCTVCGYIHDGEEAPEQCPVCGADKLKFILIETEDFIPDIQDLAPDAVNAEKSSKPDEKIFLPGGKSNIYLKLTAMMTQYHAHPILVHIPNGVLPFSVLFALIAVLFKSDSFSNAAQMNMIFVCLSMPAVLFSGYVDWQNRFKGRMTRLFFTKILCASIIFATAFGLSIWWSVDSKIVHIASFRKWIFLFFHIMILCPAVTAGYLGGKLVFNKYQ